MPHRNKRILFITGDPLFREQVRSSRFFTKHHLKHHFVETDVQAMTRLRDPVGTAYDFVVHAIGHTEAFIPAFLAINPRPPLVIFELKGEVKHCDQDIGFVSGIAGLVTYIAMHLYPAAAEKP